MNDALDTALVLPTEEEKPSKPYRTSPYTVRQYCALPYAQRRAVDCDCDAAAGLAYTRHATDSSSQPYTIGRRTLAPATSPPTLMLTAVLHPAPSPALHALNTPEFIDHDTTHPDNPGTFAVPAETAGDAEPAPLAHDGTVYESTDYERFHLLPENRVIDFRHLRKLVTLIKQKNLLHLKPLDVTPEGGIIDGQHRWAAARELGVPFFYKVGQQLSEADITTLNIAQKNWTGTDYLHFWTVKQVHAYVTLTAFRLRHPAISFSNAKLMLSDPSSNAALDDFNAGRWVAANEEVAEQVAHLMERIADEVGFKKTSHTRFVSALYRAVKVEGFDADHFLRKLNMQPRALKQQATDRQYLEMFQELYNYKTTKENHLRFV